MKTGVLGVYGHGDTNKAAVFGHRCLHVSNRAGGNVEYADTHGYKLQGSRPRCLCRFVCCTFFITLFLIASILLTLALVRLFVVPRKHFLIPISSGYDPQISSLEVTTAQSVLHNARGLVKD